MQTRTAGSIIATALVLLGLAGCRNMPRAGIGRGPDIRTIAGVGVRPDRLASEDRKASTISSRVDPPPGEGTPDRIVGRVVDDLGVPVANARVRLAVDGASGGREVQGTTNRSGQFLLKGLRPGERYTLIAEWDDGRELLLGRSSVSAPADEVRIRVASAGRSDRPGVTSGTRFESSGVALFRPEPRGPEPDRAPAAAADPPRIAPEREAPSPSRGRSGWIPTDSVRRASLDPSADGAWPDEADLASLGPGPMAPAEDRPKGPADEGRGVDRPETEDRDRRPDRGPPIEESDPWGIASDLLPQPMTLAERPGAGAAPRPDLPETTRPIARPEPAAPPRTADSRGDAAPPPVRRFEPESGEDRDRFDPPPLMTDAPAELDDRAAEPDPAPPRDPPIKPGAMQLPPSPREGPAARDADVPIVPKSDGGPDEAPSDRDPAPPPLSPLPEPPPGDDPDDPFGSDLPEPSRDDPAISDARIEAADRTPPEPSRDDPGPEVIPRPPAPVADLPPGGPEGRDAADPPPEIRWADLPPPDRLVAGDAVEEGAGGNPAGAVRWPLGLLRRFRRDRDEAPKDPGVEPVVRFDEQRHRLDDFTLPGLDGRPFRLREQESEYVLLCFWGTWCDPCLAAMPHLADLQRQFPPERLRVVAVAYERGGEGGPRSVSRAVRRLGLNYPVLLAPADGSCPVARSMEVQYYPTLVLLDREGRVVHRETGATGDKLMRLDRAIAAAMDGPVVTVTKR